MKGEGSGREECRGTDTGIASAGMSESLDSYRPRERYARVSFSSRHLSMAVGEVWSRYTYVHIGMTWMRSEMNMPELELVRI